MKRSCYKLFLLPLSPKLILAQAIANTRLSSWPISAWARQAYRGDVNSQGEVLHHQQQRYVVVQFVIVKAGMDLTKRKLHTKFSTKKFHEHLLCIWQRETILNTWRVCWILISYLVPSLLHLTSILCTPISWNGRGSSERVSHSQHLTIRASRLLKEYILHLNRIALF